MFLLKRKIGQSILINGNIRITVCGFKGSRVLLGVTAPSEIRIIRERTALICRARSCPMHKKRRDKEEGSMDLQLSEVLSELTHLFQQQCSSIDLAQEFDLANQALASGVKAQMFRAIELLVPSVHAAGAHKPLRSSKRQFFSQQYG